MAAVFACAVATNEESNHEYLFNDLGVYVNQLNNLIIYSSKARISVSNKINMPQIDNESIKSCKDTGAATLTTESQTVFRNKIRNALGIPQENHTTNNQSSSNQNDSSKTPSPPRYMACDADPLCILNPVILTENGKEHPVPCFRSGRSRQFCGTTIVREGEEVYCCSPEEPNCPGKAKAPYTKVRQWITKNARMKLPLSTNSAFRSVHDIRHWCLIRTHAGVNSSQVMIAKPEAERRPALQADEPHKRRSRRSNLSYYLQWGPLSSHYIDSEIAKIKDADKLEYLELKGELEKEQHQLLEVQATRNSVKKLTSSMCSVTMDLTKEFIEAQLNEALQDEIQAAELSLSTCHTGTVPMSIPNQLLEKLCMVNSKDSRWCYSIRQDPRSLYTCAVKEVYLSKSNDVHIIFDLMLNIPLKDQYYAYRVVSLPVFMSEHTRDKVTLSAPAQRKRQESIEDERARKQLQKFAELLKSTKRRRRSTSTTVYRTLKLSTPNFIVLSTKLHESVNQSVIAFSESDCVTNSDNILCDTAGIGKHRKCAQQIAMLTTKDAAHTALDKCLVKPSITYSSCIVQRTDDAEKLLLSTNSPIELNKVETGNFLQSKATDVCSRGTCLVREGHVFKCDGQQYQVKKTQMVSIETNEHVIKTDVDLTKLNVISDSGGYNRVAPFGYEQIDRYSIASPLKRALDVSIEVSFMFIIMCLLVRLTLKLLNKSSAIKRRFKMRPRLEDPRFTPKIL